MGATGSKAAQGSIHDPFPISPLLSKDLDKLSFAAARILNTPDIYDITNLARPGVCGDYAVFLKKGIEKKLLPFIADISGALEEVVYQNPNKMITDQGKRKQICSQLVDSMLRTIAIVVACLASIQVASQSRVVATAAVPKQVGGGLTTVKEWLTRSGYVRQFDQEMVDFDSPGHLSRTFKYQLELKETERGAVHGYIHARALTDGQSDAGKISVYFLDPVQLPGSSTVIPIRLSDSGGKTWAAGILYNEKFKSFADTQVTILTRVLDNLFSRSIIEEKANNIAKAYDVFRQLQFTQNKQLLFQALDSWFRTNVPGYQPIAVNPYPVNPYNPYAPPPPLPGYPYPAPVYPGFAQPQYGDIDRYQQRFFDRPPALGLGPTKFDVPLDATKFISTKLKSFRDLVPRQSSPAYERANTLAALENRDRTVQTGVCRDPYWTSANLATIYPWATFQFLAIKDWSKLTGEHSREVQFDEEWKNFLNEMAALYDGSGKPKLERGPTPVYFLDQLKFSKITDLPICKTNQNPRVRYKEVQEGLADLQQLYNTHVAKMWSILNSLILIIVDPDTKMEMVRLHPNVVSKTGSKAYVDAKATEARIALASFYLAVEKSYLNSINLLQEVKL